jgi:hypothetical protein
MPKVAGGVLPTEEKRKMSSEEGFLESDYKRVLKEYETKMSKTYGELFNQKMTDAEFREWSRLRSNAEMGSRIQSQADAYDPGEGKRKMSSEEGFNTDAGDDVLSMSPHEQDIEVNDALPVKLSPPPEGYRRVRITKPDGGHYEAFFNDKRFPGTKDLFHLDEDLASVAKVLPNGELTHSVLKPGEKIEELKSQTYRREQGKEEGFVDDTRDFMTSTERVIDSTIKGAQHGKQILNTLKNKIPPAEWDMLQKAGIEKEFEGRIVKPEEVKDWVKENGPRAEVHTYGMEGRVSEARGNRDRLEHELETTLNAQELSEIQSYVRTGNEQYLIGSEKEVIEKAKQLRGWMWCCLLNSLRLTMTRIHL